MYNFYEYDDDEYYSSDICYDFDDEEKYYYELEYYLEVGRFENNNEESV